jgi:hypothetical protein
MAKQVRVTSIETLDAFRSSLILFLSKAGSSLDEVGDEVRRTRSWLQQEQRMHWEGLLKRQRRQLEQAESELFTSRLSAMTNHSAARQMAVTRLRRIVRETEEKLRLVKKWARSFDSVVDPLAKKLEGMQHLLKADLPKGVTYLSNAQKALEKYTQMGTPGSEGASEGPRPAEEENEETEEGTP